MVSTRWRKLLADLNQSRQRTAVMVIAMAISIFGIGTMLTGYSILTREISRNYMTTDPASATMEMTDVDKTLVSEVRRYPGIADAEARGTTLARVRVGEEWKRLLLFVIDDFNDLRLNTFRPISGAWPPPAGTMLVERTSLRVLSAGAGASLMVKTPRGAPRGVAISGLTHDTGLAPAWQEETCYGYITRETLALLGEKPVLDELRIRVADKPFDKAAIETTVRMLAERLKAQGRIVREIQVPPPGRHPHQGQMTGVLFLFIAFSWMALLLSAILVATLVSAMLARQIREIGVMKAIGADTGQIAAIYLVMVALLGAAAVALAAPPALYAGRRFADAIAALLNFTITSYQVPPWVIVVQIGAGILVPLFAALFPITRGSRTTVLEAINDYGVKNDLFGQRRIDSALGALQGLSRPLRLALRNVFRHRGRLILSLALLAAAGGMFMTSLYVKDAWRKYIGRIYADRHYDVEIRLNRAEPVDRLLSALRFVRGISRVEAWGYGETALAQPGKIDVVTTYPDGGHGSFSLQGAPPETTMITFPLLAGRWLQQADTDAVVLNQMARSLIPGVKIGDTVLLSLAGKAVPWRVAGIVEEIGSPATAYVTDKAYARAAAMEGCAHMIRIAASAMDRAGRLKSIREIETALSAAGVSVRQSLPLAVLRTAVGEHITVFVSTLMATSALLGLVGILGLASAMSMSVTERTRELGVMRVLGATPGTIIRIVISEGMFIGGLSWVCAVIVAVPLSLLVGRIIGMLLSKTPLALSMSPFAMVLWLLIVLAVSALASAWPAYRAARLTVREALAYG